MKKLDIYILKKFLSTFVFTVLILMLVIIAIDHTEKNDNYIEHNLEFGYVFKTYIINFVPYMANMLSPITIFIATVFVAARLASHTEVVAIISSGISFRRYMVPYFIGSVMIGIVVFFMGGWVIPNASKIRNDFENQYIRSKKTFDQKNVHIQVAPGSIVYLQGYNNDSKTAYLFGIDHVEGRELKKKISASRAVYIDTLKKWRLSRPEVRTVDSTNESIVQYATIDTSINLAPKDFESLHMIHETMTIDELKAFIKLQRERGAENIETYLVDLYERYTYPFAIVILTLIGVSLSSTKKRGGVGVQIAIGFALAFVYILFVIMSRNIGQVGSIPPLLSAWVPNIIFATIGVYLYFKAPK